MTTHTFGGDVQFRATLPDGSVQETGASATSTVKVIFARQENNIQHFETEMLQLDISGGTLPSGWMIRESPTRSSNGRTSIESLADGTFKIKSFFNVFTELSIDGGTNWTPSTNEQGQPFAGKVVLKPPAA
jgi:hypothetical protein